ncbi:MAG: LysR family transcriptional regulator [Thermodesulfobacteriota bacterium]
MQIKLKISILNDQGYQAIGPGPLRLLEKIGEHKSINKAAKAMKLSYVKALKMLSFLEKDMGRAMVIRTRGGNDRGGTRLTPFAEKYIRHLRELEKKINQYAEREFYRFETRVNEFDTDEKQSG